MQPLWVAMLQNAEKKFPEMWSKEVHICVFIFVMQHHVATLVGSYNIIQNVGTMVMLPQWWVPT